MGEMADYALDQVMDAEDDRFLYRIGQMSDTEAYDLGIIDELGFYDHKPMFKNRTKQICCKFCNDTNVTWKQFSHGWKLVDPNNIIHTCTKYKGK